MLSSFLQFLQTGVTVSANMPSVIQAGTEITVNVNIRKGKYTGFAVFRQDLPAGLTAQAISSNYGTFTFEDQKVRVVWFNAPPDDELNISYKIIAHERLSGSVELNGQYSFIENNIDRKSVAHQPQMLAITPSPSVPVGRQVDIKDFAKVSNIEAEAVGAGQTIAFRQQPVWMEEERFFLVLLLVNRDAAQKYAKIDETVPSGFVAVSIDTKGGIFSFSNNIAKFIWMDMPAEPFFTVSYRLIPQGNQRSVKIDGLFTFMVNDRTFNNKVIERKETLAGLNRQQLNNILRSLDMRIDDPPVVANIPTPPPPPQQPPSQPPPARPPSSVNAGFMLTHEPGVRFRVQVAAGHKEINIPRHFRNFRLESRVLREEHEGWFKYSVDPSFTDYKDARDLRVHISNTTVIKDAFVTAYNDGKRITVQEALMASNQQWIR